MLTAAYRKKKTVRVEQAGVCTPNCSF